MPEEGFVRDGARSTIEALGLQENTDCFNTVPATPKNSGVRSKDYADHVLEKIRLSVRLLLQVVEATRQEGPAIRTAIVTKEKCKPAGREFVSVPV